MFSLLRWISGSSLWFSSLLIRILSTTGWLLGIQGKSSIKGQDVESGQDVLAAGVDPATTRPQKAATIAACEHAVMNQDVAAEGAEQAMTRRQEVVSGGGTEYKITEWNERSSKGEFISGGASGIVERLPSGDVVKSPWSGSLIAPLTDKRASCGGHGTLEILKVTQVLEGNGIPCCLVGTSALIYYGANRTRCDWHISVQTHQLLDASSLLQSHSYTDDYITARPYAIQPRSLTHTYPRFKCNGVNIFFQLLPSKDCHFDCEPSNFVRSQKGLPYPKLDVYIQSLIDTHDMVALCDIVDGTDVTEDWGEKNLDLSGMTDADWIKWKNDAIRAEEGSWNIFCLVETTVVSRSKTWEETIRGKEKRLGFKHPKELFATRFRLRGSEDPWLKDRDAV